MTRRTAVILSAVAYVLATFPLAILWHMVLFAGPYEEIQYIQREEPGFALAILAMILQGGLLAWGYPRFVQAGFGIKSGLAYSLVVGFFFWTAHVAAHAAKVEIGNLPLFFVLESLWLLVQFGVFGIITGTLHGRVKEQPV
tara:strand:- start:1106 stop:1528 length:423 start_codon:yes stop_codon:yes gene_type:complete